MGFKIFLNISPTVTNWSADSKQFSLVFEENPLADFVELPNDGRAQDELWYSNVLCGIVRGALEMVGRRLILVIIVTSTGLPCVIHSSPCSNHLQSGQRLLLLHFFLPYISPLWLRILTWSRFKCKWRCIMLATSFGGTRQLR